MGLKKARKLRHSNKKHKLCKGCHMQWIQTKNGVSIPIMVPWLMVSSRFGRQLEGFRTHKHKHPLRTHKIGP